MIRCISIDPVAARGAAEHRAPLAVFCSRRLRGEAIQYNRDVKKWCLRIAMVLMLGVLMNVAVAWCCVYSIPSGAITPSDVEPPDYTWVEKHRQTPETFQGHSRAEFFGVTLDGFDILYNKEFSRIIVFRARAGWPWRSLSGGYWEVIAQPATQPWGEAARTIAITSVYVPIAEEERSCYYPIAPILPGFVLNTIFYGAIWFALFFGFSTTCRAIRRQRGRCPMCGYHLRGEFEKGCSECGWGRGRS